MEEPQQNEYIDARERFNVPKRDKEQKVDKLITDAVGKTIYMNDPRVLKVIMAWKKAKGEGDAPDNFLDDESKIKELIEALK